MSEHCESAFIEPTPVTWGPLPTPALEEVRSSVHTSFISKERLECPPVEKSNLTQGDLYIVWVIYLSLGSVIAYTTLRNRYVRRRTQ